VILTINPTSILTINPTSILTINPTSILTIDPTAILTATALLLCAGPAHGAPRVAGDKGLSFASPRDRKLFVAVDRCMTALTKARGWTRRPYAKVGAFYQGAWCRGAGARRDCQITEVGRRGRDQHTVRLHTLFYDRSWPRVQGVGINAIWIPGGKGWGGQLYYADGAKTRITASQFHLDFRRYAAPDADPVEHVFVGASYQYKLHETTIHLPGEHDKEASRYLASSTAMRDLATARLTALERKVLAAIRAKRIHGCVYGKYKGDGVPPVCRPRPLTAAEDRKARADAQAHFARQRALLKAHHVEMYQALLKALPRRCWAPPLS
jgi:hypothetical protein